MISDATEPFFDYGRPNGVDKPNTFWCVISPKTTVGEKLQKKDFLSVIPKSIFQK